MAVKKLTDEEIEEINKQLEKERKIPKLMLNYDEEIKKLGEKEGYDLTEDYNALKNNIFEQVYSPRTNKVYTYEETQALTPEKFYNDLTNAGHGSTPLRNELNDIADNQLSGWNLLNPASVAGGLTAKALAQLPERTLQNAGWGILEGTGVGSLAYKYGTGLIDTGKTAINALKGDEKAQKEITQAIKDTPWYDSPVRRMASEKGQTYVDEKLRQLDTVYSGGGAGTARTVGNIGGNVLTLVASAGLGEVAGPALGLTSKAGSTAGAVTGGAISSGARTATYTDNPVDIAFDTIKGGAETYAFLKTASILKSAFPVKNPASLATTTGKLANVGKNVAIGATSGYVSTTTGKTIENAKRGFKGEKLSGEDWLDVFISPEHVTSAGISGLGYGIQGHIADMNTARIALATDAELRNALDRGVREIYTDLKNNNIESALGKINAGKSYINMASTTEYPGITIDQTYYNNLMNGWNTTTDYMIYLYLQEHPDMASAFTAQNYSATANTPAVVNTGAMTFSDLANKITQSVSSIVNTPSTTLGMHNATAVATQNPNLPTTDLTSAKLSEKRLDRLIDESVTKWHPDYGKAYIVRMSPDDFLEATTSPQGLERIKGETTPLDPEKLSGESQNIFLSVDMKNGEITGHEGRHRVQALKDAGVKEIDVVVYPNESSYDKYNAQNISELPLKGQYQGTDKLTGQEKHGKDITLKNLDAVTFKNIDYIKQKYLDTTGDDKTIRYSQNDGYKRIYVTRPVSKTPREEWANTREIDVGKKTVKLSDYKDAIENSMSMKEAEEMIKRAYIMDRDKSKANMELSHAQKHDIKSFNQYLNEYPERLIGQDILRQGILVNKYINHVKELKEMPELVEGVVLAYKNKMLKGKLPVEKAKSVDVSKDQGSWKNHTNRRFYETGYAKAEETRQMTDGRETLRQATQKDNGFNKSSIKKARREFVINAHDKEWLKKNKITSKEAYKLTTEWAGYKKSNVDLVNKLNEGVAYENRWTGIENSTILSNGMISEDAIDSLGVSIKGKKNEKLVDYIANTMLAIDTHQSWNNFVVHVATDRFDGHTGANYDYTSDAMTVFQNGQNNVSHEMGHRLDHSWAQDIFGRSGNKRVTHDYLTRRLTDETLEKVLDTEDERNFVRNFYNFLDDIGKNADFRNNYTIDDTEVFARFIAKFVEWTFKKANNPLIDADNGWYRDKFTEKQFKDFVGILQEKSALDNKWGAYSISKEYEAFEDVSYILDNLQRVPEPFTKLAQDAFENNIGNKEGFIDTILQNKLKYVEEEALKEKEVNATFMDKFVDTEQFRHALGKAFNELSKRYKQYGKLGTYDYTQSLRNGFDDYGYMGVSQQAVVWSKNPNKNLTVEKQNKEIEKLEKANDKLRDKLAKEKEKRKQTVFKKNQEKKDAVKAEREKGKEKLGTFKKKAEERAKEAKMNARATTTDKKMRLANNRLDKSLEAVYDKPMSKEMEVALTKLQKNTRGSIKLIDNVKNKMPSSYSHFADDVKEIVDTIYTGANKMTDEKRKNLERKAEAIQKFIKEHPEYPVSQRALDLLKEPTKKSIADLNPVDLVDMAEDVAEIGIAIRDMFAFTRSNKDAVELREKAIDFAKERRATGKTRSNDNLPDNALAYKALGFGRGELDKRSTLKTMILRLAGGNPNSPMKFINETLAEAYSIENVNTEEMLKIFDRFVRVRRFGNVRMVQNDLNDIFNHKKEMQTVLKTIDGKDYRPSIADAVAFVTGVKDPQFAGHTVGVLTNRFKSNKFKATKPFSKDTKTNLSSKISGYKTFEKEPIFTDGGIARFGNRIDQKYGSQETALKRGVSIKLTMDDYKKLVAEVEQVPHAKELMEAFKELADLRYKLINDAYEAINGMALEKRDYYFPIANDPATRVRQRATDKLSENYGFDASTTLLNSSFVKPVVEGANNQILIYPIDEVIRKMISDTAKYSAYATALYDINTFLSGISEDGQTLVQLINDIDPAFLSNYNKITNAIVGNVKHPNASRMASRYTSAILRGNIWIAMKQAGSYFTTAKYFDHPFRSLLAGAFAKKNIAGKLKAWYKEQGVDISKLNTDQVLRYFWSDNVDAELATRTRGWNTATKEQLLKHLGILDHINALDFFKGVDYATVRAIAYAMIHDTILSGKFDGSDAYFAELHNRFLKANIETQPNTSAITRTPIQTSGNALDRALAYMGDPRLKTLNMLMDARLENKYYRKHGSKEEKQANRRNYARAVVGTIGSLAFLTTIARTKKKIEGKDDGKGFKGFLKDMFGNAIALTVGLEQFTGRFLDEYSFDVELPDTQALNILLSTYDDFTKLIDNIKKGKTNKVVSSATKVIGDISRFVGIPFQNLKTLYDEILAVSGSDLYYENKIEADDNAYKKYKKYEDKIDDPKEFYTLYKATREKAVKDKYGKYNDATVKKAIKENGGDIKKYFSILKRGS